MIDSHHTIRARSMSRVSCLMSTLCLVSVQLVKTLEGNSCLIIYTKLYIMLIMYGHQKKQKSLDGRRQSLNQITSKAGFRKKLFLPVQCPFGKLSLCDLTGVDGVSVPVFYDVYRCHWCDSGGILLLLSHQHWPWSQLMMVGVLGEH